MSPFTYFVNRGPVESICVLLLDFFDSRLLLLVLDLLLGGGVSLFL